MSRNGALGAVALAALIATAAAVGIAMRHDDARLVPYKKSGASVRADWQAELAQGVREKPGLKFANLSRQEFIKRLDRAAKRYDFEVESVELLRPKQLAPMVVARSADPFALAKDVPTITRSLSPKADTGDDRTGWAWEGFYFEVRDHRENPALAVMTFWRRGGGGQWAADESLFPFPHGSGLNVR